MADLPIETRTPDQLPTATAVSPDALTTVQEPGGPVQSLPIRALLGRLISTDTAYEEAAEPDGLLGDLDHDENSIGLVFADADPAKNGWYRKSGDAGAGGWSQFELLSLYAIPLAQAWAEGSEPGGPGSKSAKEWAEAASAEHAGVLAPIINPSADEYPNLNIAANTLEIPGNTLIIARDASYQIVAPVSIDLSVEALTAKKVYYVAGAGTFVVKGWNTALTNVEKLTHHLIAVIRRTGSRFQDHLSMACKCTVNGVLEGKASPHFLSPVITGQATAPYLPNLDTAAKTLTIYGADSVLFSQHYGHLLPAAVIDLTVVASTAKKVYYNSATAGYVVKAYDTALTSDEGKQLHLLAVARLSATIAACSLSMTCPCTVDGTAQGPRPRDINTDWAAIFTPLLAPSISKTLPNYDRAANTLTFFADTVIQHGDDEWLVAADVSVAMSASSASRVWWNKATNTLVSRAWNAAALTPAERRTFVLVAAVRDGDVNNMPTTIAMTCPYCVDGKMFGLFEPNGSDLIPENRIGAKVEGIHHRGLSTLAPENTLAAYKAAAAVKNYTVEGDIRFTSDDVAVLLHDADVDRTSDGSGPIAGMTLAEAKTYDFGSWKGAAFTGETIPTWEEWLYCARKLDLKGYLELKTDCTLTQVQSLLSSAHKAGMQGRVQFHSYYLPTLQKVIAEDPAQEVGFEVGEISDPDWAVAVANCAALLTGDNAVAIMPPLPSLTRARVEAAHEAGIRVIIWTIDDPEDVITAADMGVDGFLTNGLNIAKIIRDAEL
jgi:glycerophosphoryl diester phosphodiesterase